MRFKNLLSVALIFSCLSILSCASFQKTKIVRSDFEIKALPNGNFEVTKAWLSERYRIELEQERALDNCRNLLSENK